MPRALSALRADLERNQQDIDFAEALIARGGPDAAGARERLAQLEDQRGGLLEALEALERTAAADARAGIGAVAQGPVQEFTARMLFTALHGHARVVADQLPFLDEKDAGYRGDAHIGAILALLDDALA